MSTAGPVCVTGVTGFIASHIVKELLQAGYTVHGTVRNVKNEAKHAFLRQFLGEEDEERLKLFEANLLKPNSFDAAIAGCWAVIHTASPVVANAKHPFQQLVRPAVQGTLNVLRSCAQHSETVERVIYLSSCSTTDNGTAYGRTAPYTEADWNDVCSLQHNPYAYGKTVAERLAWEFVKKQPADGGFTLITTLPGLVIGPLNNNTLPMSNKAVQILMQGKYGKFCPPMYAPYTDVRDVAAAHRYLLESSEACGRYLITNSQLPNGMSWMADTSRMLRKYYPSYPVPWIPIPAWAVRMSAYFDPRMNGNLIMEYLSGAHPGFDSSKIGALGFRFRFGLEQTMADAAGSLLERGFIGPGKARL